MSLDEVLRYDQDPPGEEGDILILGVFEQLEDPGDEAQEGDVWIQRAPDPRNPEPA